MLLNPVLGSRNPPGPIPRSRHPPARMISPEADPMPTYEYRCRACGDELEVVQSFSDDPLETCPSCGGSLRKVFAAPGISFKGSGFYKTDSKSGSSTTASPGSGDTSSEKSGEKSDSSSSNGSSSGSSDSSSSSGSDTSSGSSSDSGKGSSPSKDTGASPAKKSSSDSGSSKSGSSTGTKTTTPA
jgi:putative FmdB family regulatory protein